MNRDSAGAKIAVVLGIGAVVVGLASLRAKIAAPKPTPDRTQAAASATAVTTPLPSEKPNVPEEKPAAVTGPTQADRIALLEACTEGDQAKVEALVRKG